MSVLQNCPDRLLFNGYRGFFPGIKAPERDAHSVEIKNEWSCGSAFPLPIDMPLCCGQVKLHCICFVFHFFFLFLRVNSGI